MSVGIQLTYVHSSLCDLNYPVAVGEILPLLTSSSIFFLWTVLMGWESCTNSCRRENNDLSQKKIVNYLLIPSSLSLKFISSGIMFSTIELSIFWLLIMFIFEICFFYWPVSFIPLAFVTNSVVLRTKMHSHPLVWNDPDP